MFVSNNGVVPLNEVDLFMQDIDSMVESGIFYHKMAELLLGEDATLESIQELSKDIKRTEFPITVNESSDDEGLSLVSASLGLSTHVAGKLVKEPKSASVLFRALRDKLEDVEDKAKRAKAEENGLFATIIYTIRKAMAWLVKKFKDIRDDFMDAFNDREVGASRAKRDYVWLVNKNVDYMANNAKWW